MVQGMGKLALEKQLYLLIEINIYLAKTETRIKNKTEIKTHKKHLGCLQNVKKAS